MSGLRIRLRGMRGAGVAFGVLAAALATAARFALDGLLPPGFPFLTFFPAVILTAFLFGAMPAAASATLSLLSAWYFFLPPPRTWVLDGPTAIALGFFVLIVVVDILLFDAMHRYQGRLEAERARSQALAERGTVMFQELQHRVANNMAFVASLLMMQKRRIAADPADAGAVIDDAVARIQTLAQVHRRLYDPDAADAPIGDTFAALARELFAASGKRIETRVEMAPVRLELSRLMTLSMLVTELLTNTLKHGFAGRESGAVEMRLAECAPGRLRLVVADDGVGLPTEAGPRTGLGATIMQGLARQLDGTLAMRARAGGGAEAVIELPA